MRKNEIRLLRVLPGEEGSIVKCELFHSSLDRPRGYTALSYTWGIKEHTRLINVGGFEFPVTDNLEFALQRLRSKQHTVILWVDAICINQKEEGVIELNHQVRLMRRIYKTARRVALWLGPEENNSKLAMDLIWKLCRNPDFFGTVVEDQSLVPHFKALVLLFRREYWERIWVVQEIVNARKIAVYCGKDSIQWSMLAEVSILFKIEMKRLMRAFDDNIWRGSSWPRILSGGGPSKLADVRREDAESALLKALVLHREKLCAKPEDKVYGILGILSTPERKQFKVDYKLSAREVFLNVARYLLETQSLDFLCAVVPHDPNVHKLPSWVPDWEHRPLGLPLIFVGRKHPRFVAAGTTKAEASISDDNEILRFEGIYIDVVENLGTVLPESSDQYVLMSIFHHWYSVLVNTRENTTSKDHEDFCQTIWFDNILEGWTPTDRMIWTYRTFASLSRESTELILDDRLTFYADSFQKHMLSQRKEVYQEYGYTVMGRRRYMISKTGLQGIVPQDCFQGDIICLPLGCAVPVILRKEEHAQHYTFIGEAYINSYMYGEAIKEVNDGFRILETFEVN